MALPLSLADVLAARETIGRRLHRTPVLGSASLGARTGARSLLKAELLQRTGSFKPRGVLNVLAGLSAAQKDRGVISISAGNHAQAVAYCAGLEGLSALLVMWRGASETKIAATRGYGAEVDLEASGPGEAFERLEELIAATGRTLVHPFDDPRGIAGAGTLGLELLEDLPDVDVVVVPAGGGGLVSGLATVVKGLRPGARVVAVEPDGARSLSEGLAAGRSVRIEPRTIAGGLDAPFAGERCVAICRELVDEVVLVSDDEIAAGMRFLYARAKLACEPAGAAATAALLAGRVALRPGETVASVVSGGNVDPKIASGILAADEA